MSDFEYIRGSAIHKVSGCAFAKTGTWRVFKPILNQEVCNSCKKCFWSCPDDCILYAKGDVRINYDYCKGCGVCAYECPTKAISMEREEK